MAVEKVVVTGSIAFDYLMSFPGRFRDHLLEDQLHHVSLSFLVDSLRRQRGGTAANIAYTHALLGGRPTLMATAGQDFVEYERWLKVHGIDTSAVRMIEDEFCASFFVNTDRDHNQIASFYTGAMAHAGELSFRRDAADADLAIISPNDPAAMHSYARECRDLGIPYIYDPSQQTVRLSGDELADGLDGCLMLTVNDYEFELIKERTGSSESQILQRVGGLLVTEGKQGARLMIGDERHLIPAFPVRRLREPTGAGDAFRGGLLRGIQLKMRWRTAALVGALAATYVLEQEGTLNHHYSRPDFVARFRRHVDDEGELDVLLADRERAASA